MVRRRAHAVIERYSIPEQGFPALQCGYCDRDHHNDICDIGFSGDSVYAPSAADQIDWASIYYHDYLRQLSAMHCCPHAAE